MRLQLRKLPALAVVAAISLAGCESTNTLDPSQITVVSLSDYFSFSATALDNVSDGERYFLSMTATQAVVDVTQAISSGTAILQIRGGGGTVFYQEDIKTRSTLRTPLAAAGLWQVDVVLTKVSGEFSFTILGTP
ncbi:MAG: hypothetical protein EXR91_05830 [Gemmatimonadetes bacterium]|nr:hypothetical protein [Gemmatimonadota bacterium]